MIICCYCIVFISQIIKIHNQLSSIEFVNQSLLWLALLDDIWLLFFLLFGLLGFLGQFVAGGLVLGPISHLALPGAIPDGFAFGATFEGLFLAFFALEAFQQPFNSVVGV